jgi:hypothetical protein
MPAIESQTIFDSPQESVSPMRFGGADIAALIWDAIERKRK